jgi:hypothetical protein
LNIIELYLVFNLLLLFCFTMAVASAPRSWAKVVASDEKTVPVAKSAPTEEFCEISAFDNLGQPITYKCRRIPVRGCNYSRYVTDDGKLLVLVSYGFGAGWTTWVATSSIKLDIS